LPSAKHIGFGAFRQCRRDCRKGGRSSAIQGMACFERDRSRGGKNGPLSGPATQSGALFWALMAERFARPMISEPPKLLNGERWVEPLRSAVIARPSHKVHTAAFNARATPPHAVSKALTSNSSTAGRCRAAWITAWRARWRCKHRSLERSGSRSRPRVTPVRLSFATSRRAARSRRRPSPQAAALARGTFQSSPLFGGNLPRMKPRRRSARMRISAASSRWRPVWSVFCGSCIVSSSIIPRIDLWPKRTTLSAVPRQLNFLQAP